VPCHIKPATADQYHIGVWCKSHRFKSEQLTRRPPERLYAVAEDTKVSREKGSAEPAVDDLKSVSGKIVETEEHKNAFSVVVKKTLY